MVEVLKRGEIPAERVYRVTCRNCRSELRFKRSEATYNSDQRDGDYVSIQCPICSEGITATANHYEKPRLDPLIPPSKGPYRW